MVKEEIYPRFIFGEMKANNETTYTAFTKIRVKHTDGKYYFAKHSMQQIVLSKYINGLSVYKFIQEFYINAHHTERHIKVDPYGERFTLDENQSGE